MVEATISFESVEIPQNTNVQLILYEDVGGTGSGQFTDPNGKEYDNSSSTTLINAKTVYSLSGFDGSSGNTVWYELDYSTTNIQTTAEITHPITISLAETATGNNSIEVLTSGTIGPNTNLQATIYEDSSGDGTEDNYKFLDIPNGANTATLDGFDNLESSEYWAEIDVVTTTSSDSPTLDYLEIRPAGARGTLTWETSGDWGNSTLDNVVNLDGTLELSSLDDYSIGYIETAEQVHTAPGYLSITDLDYTLNDGNIIIEVVGSPGTSSEETNHVYLFTQSSESLNWNSEHDTYKLNITMYVESGATTAPTFNSISLDTTTIASSISNPEVIDLGTQETISSTIINNGSTTETFDVSLTLGTGLSTTDTTTKTTSSLAPSSSETLSWNVDASTLENSFAQIDVVGNTSSVSYTNDVKIRVEESNTRGWSTEQDWDEEESFSNIKSIGGSISLRDTSSQGTLTTDAKSFNSTSSPDISMNYTYDRYSTVNVDVIGSPGQTEEEIQSIELSGEPSRELQWNSSHIEFQIAITMSTTNGNPSISDISLSPVTTSTEITWSSTQDWDNNEIENGVVHQAESINFEPVWREEYSIGTDGAGDNDQDTHFISFNSQRDFYGDIRVTCFSTNGWKYDGSIEFGRIIDNSTGDWDKLKESHDKTAGNTTATMREVKMDEGKEYYLGHSRAYYYNNNGEYDTGGGEVVGDRSTGFKTDQGYRYIGANNTSYTFGFSKLEFKESYIFSEIRYTTQKIQPNVNNLLYDLGSVEDITVSVIGSPETPSREKHILKATGQRYIPINWDRGHAKFQVHIACTKSDDMVTLDQVTLSEDSSPSMVTIDSTRESEVDLSWTNNTTYDEIRVYRAEIDSYGLDDYTQVQTLLGSATSYTDTGLTTWEDYYYIIVGVVDSKLTLSEPKSAVPLPASAVGWHGKDDWDSSQEETGLSNSVHPRLLKAEPSLAKINNEYLTYYLPFDGDFRDYSGNRHHSVMTRPEISLTNGKIGQAVDFETDNASSPTTLIPINHYFDASPAIPAMTASFWVKTTKDPGSSYTMLLTYDGDYFRTYADKGSGKGCGVIIRGADGSYNEVNTNVYINDGNWHHYCITYDRYSLTDTVNIYIDGVLEGSRDIARDVGLGNGTKRYGVFGNNCENDVFNEKKSTGPYAFTGQVDDLRYYQGYAFSQQEVKDLYEYGQKGGMHTTSIKTTPSDSQL